MGRGKQLRNLNFKREILRRLQLCVLHENSKVLFEVIKFYHKFQLSGRRVPLALKLLHSVQNVDGVIKLLDFYERQDSFIYVMERPASSKDLFDLITEKGV